MKRSTEASLRAEDALRSQIEKYLSEDQNRRPLGVTVFGRSRLVISLFLGELFQSISQANRLRPFEVDMSVFVNYSQLIESFLLLERRSDKGDIPVGIFHNFDSQDGNWLKFFLAPLQDGQFLTKDKVLHKFGCCLFFFATSTTTKFSDFSLQNESRTSPKYISFQQQKGTDFVSRLGAHADDVRSRIDESPEHRVRHAIRTMSERLALEIAHDPDALMHIHDRHLEELLAEALDGIGFNVELGRGTKHGGKDIVVKDRETEKKYVIEIKHWRSGKRVNGKIISDFVKVVAREKAAKGLFVSSSGFAPDAYEVVAEIRKKNVHLGGRDKIVHLCRTFANHRSGLTVPGSELTRVLFMETY